MSGMTTLTGTLLACSSARLTPLDTHLPGLDVEHGRHRDAVLLGLDDGPDEPLEVVDLDPVGEILVGRPSRLPDLDVLERADQLLPERARGVASHVRQGSLEAETGLDHDGHLVEHVGQGELDGVAPLDRLVVQEDVREGPTEQCCGQRHNTSRDAGVSREDEQTETGTTEPQDDLGHQHPLQGPGRRTARGRQLPVHERDSVLRRDAPRKTRQS